MDIDREQDYAECRAYDSGVADYGRGRKVDATPYADAHLTRCWRQGWLDAQQRNTN